MEEKIIYRGIEIEIYQDDYCESPNDWGNTDCFLVSDYRHFFVQRKNFSVEELSECNGFFNGFYVFPVSIYYHSGIALSLGRSYGWDYSNDLCFVLVRREKGTWTRAAARERAEKLVELWDDYLCYGAYGFRIDETGDNCGGFYHCDYDAMIEEAKDCIDAFWDEKIKAFFKRKKQEIRNRIPFDKRTVYNFA